MLLDLSPLIKHKDYRKLYLGQTISFLGSMFTYVAIPYQVYQLTESSFWVGILGTVQLVPLLVFALIGGAFADAINRKKLLVFSETILTLLSLSLAVNAFLPHPSIVWIFIASACMSAVNGFHRPALDAMTPLLVDKEDLSSVAALGSLRYSMAAILGPAISGVLLAQFGIAATYLLDAVSFLASLYFLSQLGGNFSTETKDRPGLKSIIDGLKYARSRPELMGTYIVDIVAMVFAMPSALFPAMAMMYATATLPSAKAAGWLYSALPIGSGVVTLFSGWTKKVRRHGAAVILSATGWGFAIIALGYSHTLALSVFCLALAGGFDMISGIFRGTIWNETIPKTFRGRLSGIEMISYMSGPLLGNARAGTMATFYGNAFAISSGGIVCVVAVAACIFILPEFWKYESAAVSAPKA